jgi:hypothetical protein
MRERRLLSEMTDTGRFRGDAVSAITVGYMAEVSAC